MQQQNVANDDDDDDGLPVISAGASSFPSHRRLPEHVYSALDRAERSVRHDREQIQQQQQRGRRRQRDEDNFDGDDDDDDDNGDNSMGGGGAGAAAAAMIKVVGARTYEDIVARLGPPTLKCNCFGCKYVGQNRAAKIPDHRLQEVFETMAEGLGVSDPYYLAVEVSEMYERLRVNINETRGKQEPLPPWTPGGVWWHWVLHTDDPQVIKWIFQWINRSTVIDIWSTSLCRLNTQTNERVYDKDQHAIMERAMMRTLFIAKQDARKMDYYFDNAMINTHVMANGGLHRHKRPGYVFFKNTRKKPRTATVSASVVFDEQ